MKRLEVEIRLEVPNSCNEKKLAEVLKAILTMNLEEFESRVLSVSY